MIIKNKVDNEAILSNVGQVGEFRIRNSAKAFGILSSGLYANKIRAIVREYSCNAVDSHTEAGNLNTPFDVHLPNALEPWFSVRDYGVGLDEQQVRDIFTTYFESTKSNTDDLIGGLGLGSKSAFSYTDNFTIVAVKGGMKRVYTAFINEQGVPSIAPMGEEPSNDPNGVEIRFAVEDAYDFRKFYEEARHVYKHFKLRPVVSGGIGEFKFIDPEYTDRDIIPGIHTFGEAGRGGYRASSVAIMGNIEYPIQIPSNAGLGEVGELLDCGLAIEFGIGELDIQASREGLSYIPETIAAIKAKLEALNAVLADKIADEAAAIKNQWEKAFFYQKKLNTRLWNAPTKKHLTDINFDLVNVNRYNEGKTFQFNEAELAKKFNIKISGFYVRGGWERTVSTLSQQNVYDRVTGNYNPHWSIQVDPNTQFVENDTTVGAWTRSKYHWRETAEQGNSDKVYVLEKADKKQDMKLKAFLKAMANPPAERIRKASTLKQKERAKGIGKDVSILHLEKRDNKGHMRSSDMVWRDAGAMSSFDDATTYYYLPMSGFMALGVAGKKGYDMKTFVAALRDSGILTEKVYGVRKADLESVKDKSNWVNLDEFVISKLAQNNALDVKGLIKDAIGFDAYFRFSYVQNDIKDADSPYLKLFTEFVGAKTVSQNVRRGFETLCRIYDVTAGKVNVTDEIAKYNSEMKKLEQRYPLLNELGRYFRDNGAVAEYINAIDLLKK
jgi:hypothetical protein